MVSCRSSVCLVLSGLIGAGALAQQTKPGLPQKELPVTGREKLGHTNTKLGYDNPKWAANRPTLVPRGVFPEGTDDCQDPSPATITEFGNYPFDLSTATTGDTQDTFNCNFFGDRGIDNDVWWRFTPDFSGLVSFRTCGLTLVDTKLAVYQDPGVGCPGDLDNIFCSEDACGLQSEVTVNVDSGTTYYVQVGLSPLAVLPADATGFLEVIGPGGGGADDCDSASDINGEGVFEVDLTDGTTGFDGQFFPGSCGFSEIENDIWFCWTSAQDAFYTIRAVNWQDAEGQPIDFDARLAVYDICGCPFFDPVACDDNNFFDEATMSATQSPEVLVTAVSGAQFMIQVGSAGTMTEGITGELQIEVSTGEGPDECDEPEQLVGTGTFTWDNTLASTGFAGQGDPACDAFGNTDINNDIWFSWTAPADASYQFDTCGTSFDTELAVWDGTECPPDFNLDCNDDACGLQSIVRINANMGEEFLLQVGTFSAAVMGMGVLNITEFIPPENDECQNPEQISGVGTFNFDNSTASNSDDGQADCFMNIDIWYEWTAPNDGSFEANTCGTGFDTEMAVYDGNSCVGTTLGCNDDACGLQSIVRFGAVGGQSYLIRIGSFGQVGGAGALNIEEFIPPENDECGGAIEIAGTGFFDFDNETGSTGLSGQDFAECDAFGNTAINLDVWFLWTAPSDGNFEANTCGTTFDTELAVYDGTDCPPTTILDCNDDTCGLQSVVRFEAVSGQQYLIQVGSFGAVGGMGTLTIDEFIPPANDLCENAEMISGTGLFDFNNNAASTGDDGQFACTINLDVWFAWTAPNDGTFRVTTCALATFDTELAAYDDSTCPVANNLACNDDACGLQSTIEFPATSGEVYLIQVGSFGAAGGAGQISITEFIPVDNDECPDAVAITGAGTFAFDNTTATTGADGQNNADCLDFGTSAINSDIWYCWTASANGPVTVQTCGLTALDTRIAAYDGCACPPLESTLLACNDDNDDCTGLQSLIMFDAVAGRSYLIQLGSFSTTATGFGEFEIVAEVAIGACCIDQECQVLSEPECVDQGGAFIGNGTDCTTSTYEVTTTGAGFEDITDTGTSTFLGNNFGEVVPIGFDFTFFGDSHDMIGISDNGYLTFDVVLDASDNVPIPDPNAPNNLIAPRWDDQDQSFCGDVHYQTDGVAPDRRFIVQWTDVPEFDQISALLMECFELTQSSWQVVLHENGEIEFRYGTVIDERFLGDITVGIENAAGDAGVFFDAAEISSGDALSFSVFDPATACGDIGPGCVCEISDPTSVNIVDLLEYLDLWLPADSAADLNDDGVADIQDLLLFLDCFLPAFNGDGSCE